MIQRMGIVGIKEIRSEVTQKWFTGDSRQVVLLVQLEFQEFGCSFFLTNVPVFLNASFLLEYPHNSVSTTISHNWHLLTLTPQLYLNYLLGIQYFFSLNCISWWGGGESEAWDGGNVCTLMAESHCYVAETIGKQLSSN